MKDILGFLFLIFILQISCSEKQKEKPSNYTSEIKIIKLNNGKGIIFPATYSKKVLINPYKVTGVFTPSEKTIRYIDENLTSNFDSILNSYQKENSKFVIFKKDLDKYDKQFLGSIDSKKDSLIIVQIFNFESDPHNIKPRIEKEFLIGSDGWNDTNTLAFYFYIKTKKFEKYN